MSKIAIHQDDAITVWCDPPKGLIHHEMHGFCAGRTFRDALTAGTDAMKAHGATKWLSDDRANGALSPDDEIWATQTWFPRTARAGWKHWAVVLPRSVVGQMNVGRFVKLYRDLGINAQVFADPNAAIAWLDSQTLPATRAVG